MVMMTPTERREYMQCYWANNPQKKRDSMRRWRLNNPEKARERLRLWQQQNPEKAREIGRRYYANHVDKQRERSLNKVHRRRADKLKTGGDFTPEQFKVICRHFKHHCLRCGRPRKLTPDHVIPLAWSDRPEFRDVALNDIDNIQPLCRSCNSGKCDAFVDYRTTPHRHCITPPMVEDYLA